VRFASRLRGGALMVVLLASACAPKVPSPQTGGSGPPAAPAARPTPVSFKVTSRGPQRGRVVLTEHRNGRIVYILHADANVSDRFAAGTGRSVFTNPHIVFFQPGGKTLTAVAPTAKIEEQSKTVLMTGGVRAHTQDGIVLLCDQLLYDDHAQMIHGKGNVIVTTPRGERLNGDTLDSDVQFNHVRVTGGAP
jgi:LPS export ABC transporter protein LptC